jgi:hypothetical protein
MPIIATAEAVNGTGGVRRNLGAPGRAHFAPPIGAPIHSMPSIATAEAGKGTGGVGAAVAAGGKGGMPCSSKSRTPALFAPKLSGKGNTIGNNMFLQPKSEVMGMLAGILKGGGNGFAAAGVGKDGGTGFQKEQGKLQAADDGQWQAAVGQGQAADDVQADGQKQAYGQVQLQEGGQGRHYFATWQPCKCGRLDCTRTTRQRMRASPHGTSMPPMPTTPPGLYVKALQGKHQVTGKGNQQMTWLTRKRQKITCKVQAAEDGQAQGHDVQADDQGQAADDVQADGQAGRRQAAADDVQVDGQGQAADDVVDEAIVVVVGHSFVQYRDTVGSRRSDLDLILDGPSFR